MSEEPSRLGWHVVMYRHALTRVQAACVTGHEQVVVEQQYAAVRGTQPQRITDPGQRGRVQAMIELDVAITVHADLVPAAQVRRLIRQGLQMRTLQRE